MKRLVTILIFTAIVATGCAKSDLNDNSSLKEFYVESLEKDLSEISLESSKKSLEGFEYKYELQSYSEEEKEKYEKEFGKPLVVSDFSSNIFLDENKNVIDILYNETSKEVSSISYEEQTDFESKKIVRDNDGFSVDISTNDLETHRNMMNRLCLSIKSKKILASYFDLIDTLRDNSEVEIEDVKSILKLDYKKIEENEFGEKVNRYEFKDPIENISINVEVVDGLIESASMNSGIGDESNYAFKIFSEDKGSKFHIYITENVSLREDNKNDKELFDFLYN